MWLALWQLPVMGDFVALCTPDGLLAGPLLTAELVHDLTSRPRFYGGTGPDESRARSSPAALTRVSMTPNWWRAIPHRRVRVMESKQFLDGHSILYRHGVFGNSSIYPPPSARCCTLGYHNCIVPSQIIHVVCPMHSRPTTLLHWTRRCGVTLYQQPCERKSLNTEAQMRSNTKY